MTITHDQFAHLQRQILVPENSFDDPLVVRIDLEEAGERKDENPTRAETGGSVPGDHTEPSQ